MRKTLHYLLKHIAHLVQAAVWTAGLDDWLADSGLIPFQFCKAYALPVGVKGQISTVCLYTAGGNLASKDNLGASKEDLAAEDVKTYLIDNLGYYIPEENLFSSMMGKDKGMNIGSLSAALSNFNLVTLENPLFRTDAPEIEQRTTI